MWPAARIAGGSENRGDFRLQGFTQDEARVVLRNLPRTPRPPGPKIVRAGIRRPRVATDEVGSAPGRAANTLLPESCAEISRRCERLQLFSGHLPLLSTRIAPTCRKPHSTLWLTSMMNHASPPMRVIRAAKSRA